MKSSSPIRWALTSWLALALLSGCESRKAKSLIQPDICETLEGSNFSTSFELDGLDMSWTSESEDSSNVSGATVPLVRGNVNNQIVGVSANLENASGGQVAANLIDNNILTKWYAKGGSVVSNAYSSWIVFEFQAPIALRGYALTSSNDHPARNPERAPYSWRLQGSSDGATWTTLDTQVAQLFGGGGVTKSYAFTNDQPYTFYRLYIDNNLGNKADGTGTRSNITDLADVQFSDGSDAATIIDMTTMASGSSGKPGYSGVGDLYYVGSLLADGPGHAYNRVYEVNIPVIATTQLSYFVKPDILEDDPSMAATYVAVDLAFTDGTFLRDLGAMDQNGVPVNAQAQGDAHTMFSSFWNYRVSRIGEVAAGKTISRILVDYDIPQGKAGSFDGWIDDIEITACPRESTRTRPSEWVMTTRGSSANNYLSHGNTTPATALPHGFNFWAPATGADSAGSFYTWATNLKMQALVVSHAASGPVGDRQMFQVMPSAQRVPDTDRTNRSLAFKHTDEVAQAHYYAVTFANGIKAEVTPTDHAAMLRFTFVGDASSVLLDNVTSAGKYKVDAATGTFTGYSDVVGGTSLGTTRMFVYGAFDKPVAKAGALAGNVVNSQSTPAWYASFDTTVYKAVTLRMATSLISVDQAKRNLELEIAPDDTFDKVRDRAQLIWDQQLGVFEVEPASTDPQVVEDQLVTFYSNLYRLFLFPSSAYENVGTADVPVYKHAVQSSNSASVSNVASSTVTSAPVVDGQLFVNNGFWNTYRAAWPAHVLFAPAKAGEMIDGFVQHFRDGGWIPRYSSPGYVNALVSTSSDVAFADAYLKGVGGFSASDAYAAALRNATVAGPADGSTGRKTLERALFLGYGPYDVATDGLSWTMEAAINDFGIGRMAEALAANASVSPPDQKRYAEEAAYFLNRARRYAALFDPSVGFFQGKNAAGAWRWTAATYNPAAWGNDYAEGDGWNYAFTVPFDGQGLANLYGGRAALATKLDTYFATPETGLVWGSYTGMPHEMREARELQMGQWAVNNEPAHHVPYMYAYVGQPWKIQQWTRTALRRAFFGSENGQGYVGDDDTGAMSAWYLFSALGFYPLQVGTPNYVIGSPFFKKATVHLENGKQIVINAPNNGPSNVYVQSLRLNGADYQKTYLSHADLVSGAVLDFDLGPAPSQWGTSDDAVPPSFTTTTAAPQPMADLAGTGSTVTASALAAGTVAPLSDNNSTTSASLAGTPSADVPQWIQVQLAASPPNVGFYTITSSAGDPAAGQALDPKSWVLRGSSDGEVWSDPIDTRSGEVFTWRQQTRPFRLAESVQYAYYRIEITENGGGASTGIAEIELLTDPSRP